jgi:Inner membrane component of T3SS, cytoplasmic domain
MRRLSRQMLLAGALLALLAAPAAAADEAGYRLRVVTPAPRSDQGQGKAKTKGKATADPNRIRAEDGIPFLRAVVSGRVGLTAKDFVLKQTDATPPVVIPAGGAVTYRESDEPMALVILVQGNFRWMGNETFKAQEDPEDQGSIYEGAFRGLGPAIDILAKAGPAGSKAGLIVYAERQALVRQAMGDASGLSAAALGSQQDYGENVSQPLIHGLTEAYKTLARMPGYRKVLVVIGDGLDDQAEFAGELKKVTTDLREAGVEVYSIYFNPHDDGPRGQQNMAKIGLTQHLTASSRDDFKTLAGTVVDTINALFYVDFPGDQIDFDGTQHEFVLAVAGEERQPQMILLPTVIKRSAEGRSLWWVWLLVILLLLVLIVVVILIMRRSPAAQAMPAEPPPLAPARTAIIGQAGDAVPIVGWVVPLVGPNQFQTFKLQQGATVLGTGGESHIVIGDSYMSAEHAEIVCSASGFTINDRGSTNGVWVNGQQVGSHDLVDNDVFKLGNTDFKFKSIN